jgi:hypothetical protein
LDERWCTIHATHMTGEETSRLARSGAVAGLCPVTEANLGDGIFNGGAFKAEGGRYGVGTVPTSAIGVADELRQLEYAQRLANRSRNVMAESGSTGRQLFETALAGGSQALASDQPVFSREPGPTLSRCNPSTRSWSAAAAATPFWTPGSLPAARSGGQRLGARREAGVRRSAPGPRDGSPPLRPSNDAIVGLSDRSLPESYPPGPNGKSAREVRALCPNLDREIRGRSRTTRGCTYRSARSGTR